jgi:dephospho-CoA kinase
VSRQNRCPIIGLAGGIGAGKSTVAAAFAHLGCVVSDSDAQAQAILDRPEVVGELVRWWGAGVVDSGSGRIDRRAIAAIVFSDPAQRRRLESLVHPLVARERAELVTRATRAGAPAVVIDAPLLFEAGVDAECDAVVFVVAPVEERFERVQRSRGWSRAEFDRRESAQAPTSEKRARSNFLVNNAASRADIDEQVTRILRSILRGRSAQPPVGEGRLQKGDDEPIV